MFWWRTAGLFGDGWKQQTMEHSAPCCSGHDVWLQAFACNAKQNNRPEWLQVTWRPCTAVPKSEDVKLKAKESSSTWAAVLCL